MSSPQPRTRRASPQPYTRAASSPRSSAEALPLSTQRASRRASERQQPPTVYPGSPTRAQKLKLQEQFGYPGGVAGVALGIHKPYVFTHGEAGEPVDIDVARGGDGAQPPPPSLSPRRRPATRSRVQILKESNDAWI